MSKSGTEDKSGGSGGKGGGNDDPVDHDIGDDNGVDDPATHDVGDDNGVDDPATHDVGDDKGNDPLMLVLNEQTGQWIFTDDAAEHARWLDDQGRDGGQIALPPLAAGEATVAVWRFHDLVTDVYFWTDNVQLKDSLIQSDLGLSFEGEAFRGHADDGAGRHTPVGVVWDQDTNSIGNFIYAPADDAIKLAGQSDTDDLVYLGVAFWI